PAHQKIPVGCIVLYQFFMAKAGNRYVLIQPITVYKLFNNIIVFYILKILILTGDGHFYCFIFTFNYKYAAVFAHLDTMFYNEAFEYGVFGAAVSSLNFNFFSGLKIAGIANGKCLLACFPVHNN